MLQRQEVEVARAVAAAQQAVAKRKEDPPRLQKDLVGALSPEKAAALQELLTKSLYLSKGLEEKSAIFEAYERLNDLTSQAIRMPGANGQQYIAVDQDNLQVYYEHLERLFYSQGSSDKDVEDMMAITRAHMEAVLAH